MIYEVIVTTQSAAGVLHIAPMGIRRDDEFVYVAPFKPSTTLSNLEATGALVVNYVKDVRVFAGCLTGRYDWPSVPADRIDGRVLSAASAHEELTVSRIDDDELRPRVSCQSLHRVTHRPFDGFNRAQAAVLEAAILVSRLDRLSRNKIEEEIAYLRIAIDKTAGPDERLAWDWLIERIERHRGLASE